MSTNKHNHFFIFSHVKLEDVVLHGNPKTYAGIRYWSCHSIYKCSCGAEEEKTSTRAEVEEAAKLITCPHCKTFNDVHSSPAECLPLALNRINKLEQKLEDLEDTVNRID